MTDIPRQATSTATNLLLGQAISTIILAVGSVLLVRLLQPAAYGFYAMVLPPLILVQLVRDWGMPYAIQQRISRARSDSNQNLAWSTAKIGITWEIAVGGCLSLVLFFSAPILSDYLGHLDVYSIIMAAIPIIASFGVYTVGYSVFIASGRAEIAATLLVASSALRVAFSIIFVVIGMGPLGAMLGVSLSSIIIAFVSSALLLKYVRPSLTLSTTLTPTADIVKGLMRMALPLGIVSITANLVGNLTPMIAAGFVNALEFGYYGAATVIYGFFIAPFQPLVLTLLSTYSSIPDTEREQLRFAYDKSTRITAVFMGGMCVFGILLSSPIILLLYGSAFESSILLFALLCFNFVFFSPFGSITVGPLLMSNGLAMEFSLVNIIASIGMLVLALFLIPLTGVVGVLYVGIIMNLCLTLGLNCVAQRKLGISAISRINASILLSFLLTLALGLATSFFLKEVSILLSWLVPAAMAIIVLPLLIVRLGAFTLADAQYLYEASHDNALAQRIASIILMLIGFLYRDSRP